MKPLSEILNEQTTSKLDISTLIVLAQSKIDRINRKKSQTTKSHPYRMKLKKAIESKDIDELFRLLTTLEM